MDEVFANVASGGIARRTTPLVKRGGAVVRQMLPRRGDYAGLRQSWRTDLLAGLTVGVVALPLASPGALSAGEV